MIIEPGDYAWELFENALEQFEEQLSKNGKREARIEKT